MPKTSYRLPQLAVLSLASAALWGPATPVVAGPVVVQDSKQPADAVIDTSKLLPEEDVPNWEKPLPSPGAAPAKAANLPPPTAKKPEAPPAQAAPAEPPSVGKELRSSVKEAVRPVYEQLVESGAVDAVHSVKEGLGLDKNPWGEPNKAAGEPKAAGQWDTPDAAPPAKTAAQAQMNRELAGMMREKLIDQVTPWVAGLVGLYLLGYLIKLLFAYVRWKAERRNARLIQRAKRQAARSSRSANNRTRPAPLDEAGHTSDTKEAT